MTATARTSNTTDVPTAPHHEAASARPRPGRAMSSRTAARAMGILILVGWFTYGPGAAITSSLVTAPDIMANVAANQATFTAGAVMMLLNSAAVVGIGLMAFPILERHSERVALGYLATRILEGALLAVGVMSLLTLTGLSETSATADPATRAHHQALGALAVQLNDLAYQTAMATLGIGSVFLCSLLFRTGLLPRPLAAWGVIGYGVFAAGMVSDIFGMNVGTLLTIPGGLFELVFATWLIIRGFDTSATERLSVGTGAPAESATA